MPHHILRAAIALIVMSGLWLGPALAATLPEPAQLKARIGLAPVPVEVYEPHLSTQQGPVKRSYLAYRFEVIADLVFGPMWRDGADTVEFRALDGYVSRIPIADFLAHKAYLAVGLTDDGPFTVDNLRQNETDVALGPYYLIWENIDDAEIFSRGPSIWPYQVAEILRVNTSDAPLRPAGLDPALEPAVDLAKKHCLNCHKLNGFGGNKAPGDLAALAQALNDETFRSRVLEPQLVQPNTTMPPLSRELPDQERERILKLLRAYLLKMPGEG